MTRIRVMDEDLSNKIAAGEVVEKAANVVKELVENSIDAQSKSIKIELINSGLKEIMITDDGIGMNHEIYSLLIRLALEVKHFHQLRLFLKLV